MEKHIVEEVKKARSLVVKLAREIDFKNQKLMEMEKKVDETSATLNATMTRNTRLHQAHVEGMRQMQIVSENNQSLQHKLESQKNEFEQKIKELEKQLAEKELERKNLLLEKEKLLAQSFKGTDSTFPTETEDLRQELAEKEEELQFMHKLNQTLILRERISNLELQDARKELINGLRDFLDGQSTVGVKRMGEVDPKPFRDACMKKFSKDCDVRSLEICSMWQTYVGNPKWHPFKTEFLDGKLQEVIDKDDKKLVELRSTWGEAAFKAIVDALMELNDYNPSGRYVVPELWNFKDERKASLKEVVKYLINELKTTRPLKRKR